MQIPCISSAELRVEILRHWRRPLYHLASQVSVHPATLSGMLRERLPMPAAVKQRILAVLARNEVSLAGRTKPLSIHQERPKGRRR